VALVSSPALADPDKDESGKGRWGKHWDRGEDYARHDREYKEEFASAKAVTGATEKAAIGSKDMKITGWTLAE
jgi:hypothetical protein